jgi:hypothetical protein
MPTQDLQALLRRHLPDDRQAVNDYYAAALPAAKDTDLTAVVEAYQRLNPAQRREAAHALSAVQRSWLDTYSFRLSMLSVRQNDPQLLLKALVALLMIAPKSDPREVTMSIPVLYRSAVLLKRGEMAFHEAAAFAPDEAAHKLLLGFLSHSEEGRQLENWQYRELKGEHGVIYVYGSLPVPEGLK